MKTSVIEVHELTKFYGNQRGILDLTFDVQEGEIFGYLGPNGAGKTTTIRTMLDLIRPTEGGITIFGKDARLQGEEIRADIGYLPGELSLYGNLTGQETLRYLSHIQGQVE